MRVLALPKTFSQWLAMATCHEPRGWLKAFAWLQNMELMLTTDTVRHQSRGWSWATAFLNTATLSSIDATCHAFNGW